MSVSVFGVRACAFIAACLAAATSALMAQGRERPRVLIVGGANNHDVEWTTPSLARILDQTDRFEVETTTEPSVRLASDDLGAFAAIVLDDNGPRWGEAAERRFLEAVTGGVGVVVVHAANNAHKGWTDYEKLVGLCWRETAGHGRFHPFDVDVVDPHHPITRGLPSMRAHPDELYHGLSHMHGAEFRVLMSAFSDPKTGGSGRFEPMALVSKWGEGRVFHTPLGHVWRKVPRSRASHADPQFRTLIARGVEWAATGSVTLPAAAPNRLTRQERDAGFELLFDGETMDGWRAFQSDAPPAQGWSVAGGALVHAAGGGGGDLVTSADDYGDFELRFEWRVEDEANSGVIYRVGDDASTTWQTGPEYQVLDDRVHDGVEAVHGAGALYALDVVAEKVSLPAGTWNTGRIILRGWHVQHWLNGVLVADLDLGSDAGKARVRASKFGAMPEFATRDAGRIALQDHGDGVSFRSLRLRRF